MSAEPVTPARFPWSGTLTLTPGAVLYRGAGGDASLHAHHAVQVMVTLDEPFVLEFEDDDLHASAAVVPSGLRHRLRCNSHSLLLVLVEPFGPRGRGLSVVGERSRGQDFEDALTRIVTEHSEESNTVTAIDCLVRAVTPQAPKLPAQLSEPVRSALRYLEQNSGSRPTLARAAAEAHISPSRLTHLFTREVGIPFRRYGLWLRLRTVAERVAGGDNLTDAAVAAGFSDSSHLSRVFKSNFGLSPSALLGMRFDPDVWPEGTN
ncbi:helix-turn-helix transcriptional regulator [Rhodococcus spongiicola]|uniref:AraC family transcriptional regulator n=1 Tax=Rhodococcus spongiicola TaxID=2487352 RepID=A0A438AP72_9NOCA|nr:AraC family transcriptional regulator [Rhodococcus spongiicola]RVW00439.1 AraC family transcriptional regulator [Rhodococcus spongiicola]